MNRSSLSAVALVLVAASGCGRDAAPGPATVEHVEAALADRFLSPLEAAGVAVEIERTCYLATSSADAPWHLETRLRLGGTQAQVADILQGYGVVVVRDRSPMIVQQEPGDPGGGWNGSLAAEDRASSGLGLTFNNVAVDESIEHLWSEECPTSE